MGKLSNIKILLVDDDPNVRVALKEKLIAEGGLVAEASDSDNAFKQIKGYDFDVVVSDLRIPNKSGTQLVELFRSYAGKAPKLILMSSFSDISTEQAKKNGQEELYLKPKNVKSLIEIIAEE